MNHACIRLAFMCKHSDWLIRSLAHPYLSHLDLDLQGSARVIRCLMGGREKLSSTCRAVLFDEEIRFSGNIDFQYPMKEACKMELDLYCKDVPHGQARAIRWVEARGKWAARVSTCFVRISGASLNGPVHLTQGGGRVD